MSEVFLWLLSVICTMSEDLKFGIATSNPGKLSQFRRNTPIGVEIIGIEPQFDEDQIKRDIPFTTKDGADYVAAISREKFARQRSHLKETSKDEDLILAVSDSAVMIKDSEGKDIAVNRDGLTLEEREAALSYINAEKNIGFVGALTFGRQNGQSAFTTLTYMDAPISASVNTLPQVTDLPYLVGDGKYRAGFISYTVDKDGKLQSSKQQVVESDQFEDVRPYISGQPKEVKELAIDVGKFDRITGPILEELVSLYPFNTLSFHALQRKLGVSTEELYERINEQRKALFARGGGNCSLHSLELIELLSEKGIDTSVAIYPSSKLGIPDGHSAVLTKGERTNFLLDPGLSIPFAVPITNIPLYPTKSGTKNVLTQVRDINGDKIPDMALLTVNGKTQTFPGKEVVSAEVFEGRLPDMLTRFHQVRNTLKLDYHDKKGDCILGISYVVSNDSLQIKNNGVILVVDNLADFLGNDDKIKHVIEACKKLNLDSDFILGEIQSLA